MNPQQQQTIARLQEALELAAPGEWTHAKDYGQIGSVECANVPLAQVQERRALDHEQRDLTAAFIAAANPTAIRSLLDLLREQEGEIASLTESLKTLVVHDTYETEYDGRMETYCHGCQMDGNEHAADCEYLAARAVIASVLGDGWDAPPPKKPAFDDRVPCPTCGKRVAFGGLKAHTRAVHNARAALTPEGR